MARALRIERPGGRYHASARGNERKPIFRDDADRFHFLALLADLGPRFGTRVHAYVLMDNHFHLLLETPEANLSRSMQWLGVTTGRLERADYRFAHEFRVVDVAQRVFQSCAMLRALRVQYAGAVCLWGSGAAKDPR
jgi:REP-associated tyrosine transposase